MHPPPPPASVIDGREAAHAPDRRERTAVLDAVRPEVERELGKPVRFEVQRLWVEGRWAFLQAAMQDPHGGRFSYAGTSRADDAAHGAVSDRYVALLSHSAAGWSIVAAAIGPTDVPQEGWAVQYGAPLDLFAR